MRHPKGAASTMMIRILTFLCMLTTAYGFILESTPFTTSATATSTTERCADEGDLNCAVAQEYFPLCSDVHHAKVVCRRYCNLCDLVDGNWAEWAPWSGCSVTCGNGQLTRTRTCTNPAPANLGLNCNGTSSQHTPCSLDPCPVHGGWSRWSPWGTCSVSCDVGIQRRDRNCSNPPPQHFGDHCFGESLDDRLCFPGHCADGRWSSWNSWGSCSKTNGIGIRTRERYCNNPAPSMLGAYCRGPPLQTDTCGVDVVTVYTPHGSCCIEYLLNQYGTSTINTYGTKVRLCDGNGTNSCNAGKGRIEVTLRTPVEWGTVCDDSWTASSSNVFCRSIGYHRSDIFKFIRRHPSLTDGELPHMYACIQKQCTWGEPSTHCKAFLLARGFSLVHKIVSILISNFSFLMRN